MTQVDLLSLAGLVTAVALLAAAPHLLPPSQPDLPSPPPPLLGDASLLEEGGTQQVELGWVLLHPSLPSSFSSEEDPVITNNTSTSQQPHDMVPPDANDSLLVIWATAAHLVAATLLSHAQHLISVITKSVTRSLASVAATVVTAAGGSASAVSLSGLSLAYALPVLGVLEGLLSSGMIRQAQRAAWCRNTEIKLLGCHVAAQWFSTLCRVMMMMMMVMVMM
jgi:hypothetical protein